MARPPILRWFRTLRQSAGQLWFGFRRRWARRLLIEQARRPERLSWRWRLLSAIYFWKRLTQDLALGQFPRSAVEWVVWRREIAGHFWANVFLWSEQRRAQLPGPYADYRANNRLLPAEADAMRRRAFSWRPLISVVTPAFNSRPEWLARLANSLVTQTYDKWEWILVDDASTDPETSAALDEIARRDSRITVWRQPANGGVSRATNQALALAEGEFIAFVDHDDELLPDALWYVADRLNRDRTIDAIYTDEELLREDGEPPYPHFKPSFSPELLTAYNYMCHLLVMRKSLIEQLGGLDPATDGAQDFDLILRAVEAGANFANIPRILYLWRLIPKSLSRQIDPRTDDLARDTRVDAVTQSVVRRHFARRGFPVDVALREGWAIPVFPDRDLGKVSIIICTRDHPRLLWRVLRSLKKTTYPNYEVILVDNGSENWLARLQIRQLSKDYPVLWIPQDESGFNFSRLNNLAASFATGEYLVFLNDDTEVLAPGWLSALVGYAQLPGVGAVGARLLFRSRRNQHAGVIVGAMGWGPWHALMGTPADNNKYLGYFTFPHNCSAVTAACMLTRKDIFQKLGGFNESAYAVCFNDVDYCLRLNAAGLRTVYAPQAELRHDEGQSRGTRVNPRELSQMAKQNRGIDDPYWNPNYSRETPHFGICSRRRLRGLVGPKTPRVLAVGRASTVSDAWPHWEAIVDAIERRGWAEFLARPFDPSLPPDDESDWWALLQHEMEWSDCNVLLASGPEMARAVELASQIGLPVIWNLPEQLLPSLNATGAERREFWKIQRALSLPYQVIFNNTHSLAWAARGAPRGNFQTIDGVLFDDWQDEPGLPMMDFTNLRRKIRTELAVDDETVVVVAAAPLAPAGELDWVLESFASLSDAIRKKCHLLLLGLSPTVLEHGVVLSKACQRFGADITLRVAPTHPWEYFAGADIFTTCPTTDIRSLATLQALRHGLAILAPEVVVRADLLAPLCNGLRFHRFDRASWAKALEKLTSDPALRGQMGENSVHWLASRAASEWILQQWSQLFREASELNERLTPAAPAPRPTRQRAKRQR